MPLENIIREIIPWLILSPGKKRELNTADHGVIEIPPATVEHLRIHPEVWEFLETALAKVVLSGRQWVKDEIDFGRIIGRTGCVTTPLVPFHERSTFVRRPNRFGPSRVMVTEEAREVSPLVVVAQRIITTNRCALRTAYIGTLAPLEPWDRDLKNCLARRQSLEFWSTHTLVYQPKTGDTFEKSWQEILS